MSHHDLATAGDILAEFYPEHQFSEEEIRILALALSVIPENLESASGGLASRHTADNITLLRALRILVLDNNISPPKARAAVFNVLQHRNVTFTMVVGGVPLSYTDDRADIMSKISSKLDSIVRIQRDRSKSLISNTAALNPDANAVVDCDLYHSFSTNVVGVDGIFDPSHASESGSADALMDIIGQPKPTVLEEDEATESSKGWLKPFHGVDDMFSNQHGGPPPIARGVFHNLRSFNPTPGGPPPTNYVQHNQQGGAHTLGYSNQHGGPPPFNNYVQPYQHCGPPTPGYCGQPYQQGGPIPNNYVQPCINVSFPSQGFNHQGYAAGGGNGSW